MHRDTRKTRVTTVDILGEEQYIKGKCETTSREPRKGEKRSKEERKSVWKHKEESEWARNWASQEYRTLFFRSYLSYCSSSCCWSSSPPNPTSTWPLSAEFVNPEEDPITAPTLKISLASPSRSTTRKRFLFFFPNFLGFTRRHFIHLSDRFILF